MLNDYGIRLDRNGYAPSILQDDLSCCFMCSHSDMKLDRHEVFHGSNRQKSKAYGLWVMLCHDACHLYGVHKYAVLDKRLKKEAQHIAMEHYGWTAEEFIKIIGRNYI